MVQNIVDGMQNAHAERIAYCASAGVEDELSGLIGKAVSWTLRHALADHRQALNAIKSAGLDLTIARPISLNTAAFDPDYAEAFTGMPAGFRPIPRASVADFLVKSLEHPETYSHTSVGLTLGK